MGMACPYFRTSKDNPYSKYSLTISMYTVILKICDIYKFILTNPETALEIAKFE